jgi:hypothetical protein
MSIIYQATNLVDGCRYIGRSDYALEERLAGYRDQIKIRNRPLSKFETALRDFGIDQFRFVILKETAWQEVVAEETRMILALKPEYNARPGHVGRRRSIPNRPPKKFPADWCLPSEVWRAVVGWEGYYEVSDMGRVRSVPGRAAGWSREAKGGFPGRIIKGAIIRDHRRVSLSAPGRPDAVRFVHNLMLEAFVGPRPENHWGLHKDDKGLNNILGNLYWGTPSQNAQDAIRNGGKKIEEGHHAAKLTKVQAATAHELRGSISAKEIGETLGVSEGAIRDIFRGKTWRSVYRKAQKQYVNEGEAHYKARLTVADVIAIRRRADNGDNLSAMAREYGCSTTNIWHIKTRTSWRGVP